MWVVDVGGLVPGSTIVPAPPSLASQKAQGHRRGNYIMQGEK